MHRGGVFNRASHNRAREEAVDAVWVYEAEDHLDARSVSSPGLLFLRDGNRRRAPLHERQGLRSKLYRDDEGLPQVELIVMGIELAALSQVLGLIKGLIGLENDSRTDQRLVFNETVRPLYEQLAPIAISYRSSLRGFQQNLEDVGKPLATVVRELDMAREGIVMSRAAILGALEGATKAESASGKQNLPREDLRNFLLTIRLFFYDDPLTYDGSIMSVFRDDAVALIKGGAELEGRFVTTREELAGIVNSRCSSMEDQWFEVSRAYGELKQQYYRL